MDVWSRDLQNHQLLIFLSDWNWQSESPGTQFYLCPTPQQDSEHCSNVICNPFSYVFLSSSHFCLFLSLTHSSILSLFFLCPTLLPSLLSSPLLFPPLFLTLFLLPVTLISPLSPLPPFLTLCLFSPLSQFLLLELKGSSLAQAWGLLGARGGHCVPWFILGLPQLCAVHLGSSVNFPSSEIGTKSKGEGDSANGLFRLCRNQRSPQRNVFTSMTHKAWMSWRRGVPGTAIKPSRWVWWRSKFPLKGAQLCFSWLTKKSSDSELRGLDGSKMKAVPRTIT